MLRSRALPLAFLLASLSASGEDDSPAKLMASREVKDRLMGIFLLARDHADPKAEDLLLAALQDPDWEVVEQSAEALAQLGTAKSTAPLVQLALTGETRRMRLAAGRALARIAPEDAAQQLASKSKGTGSDGAAGHLEVLALIGGAPALEAVDRVLDSKKPEVRREARLALGDIGGAAQFDEFAAMLKDADLQVRIAGGHGLARTGDDRAVDLLLARLSAAISDVEERRVRRDVAAMLRAKTGDARETTAKALFAKTAQGSTARHVRLLFDLATDAELHELRDRCVAQLFSLVDATSADIRAAAIKAMATAGAAEHAARIAGRASSDGDPKVRIQALRALAALQGKDAGKAIGEVLAKDQAPAVREEAAALLGMNHLAGAEPALVAALGSADWPVATAAAISLGELRHVAARADLAKLADHKDWRMRGAAVLALAWLRDREATDVLIAHLGDKDPSVKATAQNALARITGQDDLKGKAQWDAWWQKNRATVEFIDHTAAAQEAAAEGYSPDTGYALYENVDVVAIPSPRAGGDHIEALLERYKIKHRLAPARKVTEAGLHPFAIVVTNCTGEIAPEDVERIEWFVRAGGYLFASCWALTETVNKAFPGIVHMHPTPQQVLDEVRAEALSDSGLMRGVLRPATRTRYVLEGSHLIDVEDKERFEVLIDSPECAARWGEGNLAGFFQIGHGIVFDSANHFDLQGMKKAVPKTAKERKVMAMDVLGYSHTELRELDRKGVFKSETKCAAELEDLSMFRLVTNFVGRKRRAEL